MFSASVIPLWLAATKPTFMSLQLVCSGCGSEFMSCGTASLFTNVTRDPRVTTMSFGDTPADVIVIVVVAVGFGGGAGFGDGLGDGDGPPGLLEPPQDAVLARGLNVDDPRKLLGGSQGSEEIRRARAEFDVAQAAI